MKDEILETCKTNIFRTGFPLEFKISKILEDHGWSLIHNRYYIDETQEIEREIDIIAYKTSILKPFMLVTSLQLSSKKSETDYWCFLTKKFKKSDPNIDPLPIHNSTNNKILNLMFDRYDWKKDFYNEIDSIDFLKEIYRIDKKVFAFQQMCKKKNTPQNDKNIFSSISSLIRSENFEINNLGDRVKDQHIYNFNLISIADTEFINFHFITDEPEVKEIDNIKYLNRHITKIREDFYKVDFIRFSKFDDYLINYDKLHDWNTKFYLKLYEKYYEKLIEDDEYWYILEDKFFEKIMYLLRMELKRNSFDSNIQKENVSLYYDKSKKILEIALRTSDEKGIQFLNKSITIRPTIENVLAQVYRYKGNFKFCDFPSIPF